jgi:collagenase-like PrtC family protease
MMELKTDQTEVMARLQEIFDELFLDEVVLTPELSAHDVVEATNNVGDFVRLIIERLDDPKR